MFRIQNPASRVYNINYTPTTLAARSWKEITCGSKRTKQAEWHWPTQWAHRRRRGRQPYASAALYPEEDSRY
jgi:hypothetical protein